MYIYIYMNIHTYAITCTTYTTYTRYTIWKRFFPIHVFELSTKPRDHLQRYVFGAKFSEMMPRMNLSMFLFGLGIQSPSHGDVITDSFGHFKNDKNSIPAAKNPPWLKENLHIYIYKYIYIYSTCLSLIVVISL